MTLRTRGDDWVQWNCLPNMTSLLHIRTHRNSGNMHRAYNVKVKCGVRALRGKWTPIPSQEVCSNWRLLAKAIVVLSIDCHWECKLHFRQAPCPAIDNQNKPKLMELFVNIVFSHIVSFGHFYFTDFGNIYYCFKFCVFMGFVFPCMCLRFFPIISPF